MTHFHNIPGWSFALLVALSIGSIPRLNAKQPSPVLPPGFVYLRDVAPTILQDMRYASDNNFTSKKLPGYQAGECVLRTQVANALFNIQQHVKSQGLTLKVYDCYRPKRAVAAFALWASNQGEHASKNYYPRIAKTSLFKKGYIARRSGHSMGSTVDLTLVRPASLKQRKHHPQEKTEDCTSPRNKRAFDTSVDMGNAFDCFDVLSHTNHPGIRGHARLNRQNLRAIMTRFGFANYRKEWWHYSFKKRRYPRTYYDFVIRPRPVQK